MLDWVNHPPQFVVLISVQRSSKSWSPPRQTLLLPVLPWSDMDCCCLFPPDLPPTSGPCPQVSKHVTTFPCLCYFKGSPRMFKEGKELDLDNSIKSWRKHEIDLYIVKNIIQGESPICKNETVQCLEESRGKSSKAMIFISNPNSKIKWISWNSKQLLSKDITKKLKKKTLLLDWKEII